LIAVGTAIINGCGCKKETKPRVHAANVHMSEPKL